MPRVSFKEFVAGICAGNLASFSTDTVPALAVLPDRAHQIFEIKQRSLEKPLTLMAASVADLWDYVAGRPEEERVWQQIAERYLPGALTLVLPATDRVPSGLNLKDATIGLRVPNHPLAQAILQETGALATTSANRSGQPPLHSIAEIEQQFPNVLTLLPMELCQLQPQLESEVATTHTPSTVIRWTGTGWEVLRQGAIVLN
jgi:L-threonylcarbamoyladenylate synthase